MKLILGICAIYSWLTIANCCVQEYNELEEWVIRNVANLDNLTAGFFPANLQPSLIVEIFFHVNGTPWDYETYLPRPAPIACASFTQKPSTSCRTDLELCAAYNNSDPSCVHLFRWSLSPIYLFMEPRLLSDMALNYLPGTELRVEQVHLVIPEICDNATTFVDEENGRWDRGVLLLNKLATFLRGYSICRQAGIEPSSQGYATFCNSNNGAADYVVVEHEQLYRDNLVATGISLSALALFASLAAPILIYQQYGKIYTYTKNKTGNFLYLTWSIVTLCTVADYLLSFLALFYHIQCWSRPHYDSIYKNLYAGALGVWVAVGIFDLPIATLVVLKSKKKDFPVPDLVRYITCHFHSCPWVGREITNTYFIQILAVWHTLAALQIFCFHAVFVFVAFVAQPLHTGLTMIFYAATVFCLTTTIMLLYASFHVGHYVTLKQCKMREFFTNLGFGVLQTLIFIFFLFTIIFFGFTFLRITVFVGDTESSRISGLVGSVLPSVLIAIFGFMAKKLLDNYTDKSQKNGDEDTPQNGPNPVDYINNVNFDGVDNTVIMLNPSNVASSVKANTL